MHVPREIRALANTLFFGNPLALVSTVRSILECQHGHRILLRDSKIIALMDCGKGPALWRRYNKIARLAFKRFCGEEGRRI